MARKSNLALLVCYTITLFMVASVSAQSPQEALTQPAQDDGSLYYEVIAVKGKVRVGPSDLDPKFKEGWSYVKIGDHLKAGQQIFVPFRGAIKFVARPAEPPTVIKIERCSRVNISELSLTEGVAKSRLDLAYGTIKAGVAEGRTRSDMEIKSPVATLSKRGTDIFGFEYHNGRFKMTLSERGRGLIQAIQMRSTAFGALAQARSRNITPGQFVTHQMSRAIDSVQFDRQINVNDVFGLGELDQLFTMMNNNGIGFLLPQGTNVAGFFDVPTPDGQVGTTPAFDPDAGGADGGGVIVPPIVTQDRRRHEGDFGIGQGPVQTLLGKTIRSRAERKRALIREIRRKR